MACSRYSPRCMNNAYLLLFTAEDSVVRAACEAVLRTRHALRVIDNWSDALTEIETGCLGAKLAVIDFDPRRRAVDLLALLHRRLPVLVLGRQHDGIIDRTLRRRGAAGYLLKPVNASELVDAIDSVEHTGMAWA